MYLLVVKEMPPSKLPQKTQRPYTSSVTKVVGKCAAKVAVCAAHGEIERGQGEWQSTVYYTYTIVRRYRERDSLSG